jgi:DNA-binding HxlR family transcriptional regulator
LLVEGPVRFGALKRALPGVTQHMLTAQLKDLVTSGMVIRRAYPEVPPKVEYELSQAGVDVLPILQDLLAWATKHDASLALAHLPTRVVTRPDARGAERSG